MLTPLAMESHSSDRVTCANAHAVLAKHLRLKHVRLHHRCSCQWPWKAIPPTRSSLQMPMPCWQCPAPQSDWVIIANSHAVLAKHFRFSTPILSSDAHAIGHGKLFFRLDRHCKCPCRVGTAPAPEIARHQPQSPRHVPKAVAIKHVKQ